MKRITIKWVTDEYEEMTNHVLVGIIIVHDMETNTYLGEWVVKVGKGSISYTTNNMMDEGHKHPALPENIFEDHIDKMVRMYWNGYYKEENIYEWMK
jgi:hypothetical protein